MTPPEVIVVAGVAGSGKTTVGRLLADRLGWDYAEADVFHTEAAIEKMRAGHPLTDEDRLPWLRTIAAWIDDRLATHRPGVVSCSALKRSYRALLAEDRPAVRTVMLTGDQDLIAARMRTRKGHFFSADLLATQFADLELPTPAENVLLLPITTTPAKTVDRIVDDLALTTGQKERSPRHDARRLPS